MTQMFLCVLLCHLCAMFLFLNTEGTEYTEKHGLIFSMQTQRSTQRNTV